MSNSIESQNLFVDMLDEAEKTITYFLQVIEDASRYLFSLNHSQPYSYEGYASAWLRYYYPLERLLIGLDEINNTSLINDERSDYRKIHNGIKTYLENDNYLASDLTRNKLLIEGISYILYSKTDKPIQDNIYINPLPYSLNENANLFKEIYFKFAIKVMEFELFRF